MGKLTLILGGSNSGKSEFTENLAKNHRDVLYIATAEPIDDEMKMKLKKHRESRPPEWKTIEEPVHIDTVIEKEGHKFSVVLVECILLFVNNIIIKYSPLKDDDLEKFIKDKLSRAVKAIKSSKADFYVVSGEVGLGLIAENKLTRLYGRVLGQANRLLAENAAEVFFVVAGIPTKIK
ncbi:MAG TPA: bifunctional adenosylcobinamide kinase/adenosylcobinamide-phosphate guanylyltransferase [Nitrospinota bacterium]|nr:bifunctional adenosylcobinamide kinase/adenosylcobinamide-phosphate guanylyltransferase [Nitrospinota bacterium]